MNFVRQPQFTAVTDLVDYITLSGDKDQAKSFINSYETSKKPVFEWVVGPKGERKTDHGYLSPRGMLDETKVTSKEAAKQRNAYMRKMRDELKKKRTESAKRRRYENRRSKQSYSPGDMTTPDLSDYETPVVSEPTSPVKPVKDGLSNRLGM